MKGRFVPKHMLIETHSNPSDRGSALQDHIATVSDGRRRRGSRRSKGSAVLKTAMVWHKFLAVWWQYGADASRIERWSCDTLSDAHPGWIRDVSVL